MSNHMGPRHRGKIKIPPSCHPFVKHLIQAANFRRMTLQELGDEAGVSPYTLADWRWKAIPRLDLLEAALNVLGLELRICPRQSGTTHESNASNISGSSAGPPPSLPKTLDISPATPYSGKSIASEYQNARTGLSNTPTVTAAGTR